MSQDFRDQEDTEKIVHSSESDTQRARLVNSSFSAPTDRTRRKPELMGGGFGKDGSSDKADSSQAGYIDVKGKLHARLLNEMDQNNLLDASEDKVREYVQKFVQGVLSKEDLPLNEQERRRLADDLTQETLGVGPLAPLLLDPAVTDILVNGPKSIYIERFGWLEKTDITFRDNDHLMRIIQRIAASVGRRVDEGSPMVDARLSDGSRVNATIPPVSIDGPTLSIRRFGRLRLRMEDLLRLNMFSEPMIQLIQGAVKARCSIMISGGAGAGKSTFLGAVAEAIPTGERIVTIEDAAELMLEQEHVVRLETRASNIEGRGRINTRDLVINSLRMRPDRIIVGEVRGAEALDMLQAMNTGHDGSMTTIHANSPRDALSRLETMVLMAGTDLPSRAIREQIASAIQLIVHVRRYEDGVRRVESIAEITGLEGLTPKLQNIFEFERLGFKDKKVEGRYRATNIVPRIYDRLRMNEEEVPISIFRSPEER